MYASIGMRFVISDPELLERLARERIAEHGMGVEVEDGDYAELLFEYLIGSNPGVEAFLDIGVELEERVTGNEGDRP